MKKINFQKICDILLFAVAILGMYFIIYMITEPADHSTVSVYPNSSYETQAVDSADSTVNDYYWVTRSEVYHVTQRCPTLSNSKDVHSGNTPPEGRRACKVCS